MLLLFVVATRSEGVDKFSDKVAKIGVSFPRGTLAWCLLAYHSLRV